MAEEIQRTTLRHNASALVIEEALLRDDKRLISKVNWEAYPEKVTSFWKMLHGPDAFFLYFETLEPFVRAMHTGDGSPVCEDSCVEFFVSFSKDQYYNFEFNPIGAFTIQSGTDRHSRITYKREELEGLRVWTSEASQPFDTIEAKGPWRVWAVIPFNFFTKENFNSSTKSIRANFYKCGDALPNQHYLSWASVETENPDFHRPEYFSELVLQS